MTPPSTAPSALVEEELRRLIDSDALRRAPSHSRLLRYLVERRVAGDDSALRETSIALEVFRRDPATYDPQSDPIVRVTAGRLRERLEAHYARYDRPPVLRIVLPRGRYAPEFVVVGGAAQPRHGGAVMRTRNLTADPLHDALCEGLADRLADGLARLAVPRIIARDSVAQAQADGATAAELGVRLDIEWVIEPQIALEAPGRLRVTARLIDTGDASVRWVETRAEGDARRFEAVDAVVDRVLARFAAGLRGDSPAADATSLAALSADERQALEVANVLSRERDPAAIDRALALLGAIVDAHPECAAAWGATAVASVARAAMMDLEFAPVYASARAAAERALALDADRADAAIVLAQLAGILDLAWSSALAQLRDLLRRYPHLTHARSTLASLLMYSGAFDEALAEIAIGRSHDPLSVLLRMNSANVRTYARRHAEARREWRALGATGASPFLTCLLAGNNELWDGEFRRAQDLYAAAAALRPDQPMPRMCLAWVAARRGERADARSQESRCLRRHPHVAAYHRAMLAGALRDKPRVLAHLADARARHDPLAISACVDPSFDWLAGDADFNRLLRRWGLPGWRGVSPATG